MNNFRKKEGKQSEEGDEQFIGQEKQRIRAPRAPRGMLNHILLRRPTHKASTVSGASTVKVVGEGRRLGNSAPLVPFGTLCSA